MKNVADRVMRLRYGTTNVVELRSPYTLADASTVFNVKDYGATGNGTTDDSTALAAAITAAAASGGIVSVPAGTYLVSRSLGGALSNVTVQGAGRFVSVIKLISGSSTHVFDITGNNWTIRDLGIDGNDAGSGAGHGIRISGDHHTLDTLYIHDTGDYGIGCAQGTGTSLRYATFTNLYVKNTGIDGIDIKDKVSANTANRLSNITIESIDRGATGSCAGIDCRGPVQLANITILLAAGSSANGAGIRFRETSVSTGPVGAYQSTLTNARIVGDDSAQMYGLVVNAQGVNISNVYVNDMWRGVGTSTDVAQVSLTNVVVEDANSRGFEIASTVGEEIALTACCALDCATSFYLSGDNITAVGCVSRDATTTAFDVRGDRVQIRGGRVAAGAGTAVSINASADGTQLLGLDLSQQSAGTILSNSGTTTRIGSCVGTPDLDPNRPFARIDAQRSLVDDNSAQALFPSTGDALTVVAGATYRFRCIGRVIKGTNSVTFSFLFGGDATFTTCNYVAIASVASAGSSAATATITIGAVSTAVAIVATSVSTNERWLIDGEFEINAAGTIIPQVQFSGATGSTPTVELGTIFECWQMGGNPVTTIGPWA